MTDARAGSIKLIADARINGTAAYVQTMYAVVDFLPDKRHIALIDAVAAIVEATQVITVQAANLHAVIDMAQPSAAQAGNIYLIADINPSTVRIGSAYAIVDAVRPKFAQADGINAVVNARNQKPRALVDTVIAIANARSATPRAMTAEVAALVSARITPQVQASDIHAVVELKPPTQVQAGNTYLVADGSAKPQTEQTQIGAFYAVVNGVLAGEPHEYLPNRMRHGKRSKIGAISAYGHS